jgi:RNA polymerase sigma-70 factor (ECF subfamily)
MDVTSFDDESLLRLIQHEQDGALSALYDRYQRLVYSMALSALGDSALAEEVTQDVFLRVWKRAETYRSEQGKVSTWLVRITRNRSIDMIRHKSIRPEAHSVAWDDLPGRDPVDDHNVEQAAELTQQRQRVRRAVLQLPAEQKEALALAYFQGLTHQEIADQLGQPLGTIKTRLRLAMQKLKTSLAE